MYIQITTKCNMKCDHCGFSCSPDKGENMSFEVFKNAIDFSDEYATLGGGEPTVHPEFEKFLLYAISKCEYVFIVTNGKHTERALMLYSLTKSLRSSGKFCCELSQDPYHDEIDYDIIEKFESISAIRDTSSNLSNTGRCDFGHNDHCVCEDFIIAPTGLIYQCGCEDSPVVGNVYNEHNYLGESGCHKSICQDLVESL